MNKKNLILILILIFSSLTPLLVNGDNTTNKVSVTLKMKPISYYVLGPELVAEFNRTIMIDEQTYTQEDEIWFGFIVDVADDTIFGDENIMTFVDQWYYNTTDPIGRYNVTRFQGRFNVYLDDIDLGLSNFAQWSGYNSTQDISVTLTEGWHLLTIIAGEVVSDEYHNSFDWVWKKDSLYFYVSAEEVDSPPTRKLAQNFCEVKSNPTPSSDFVNHFEWTWTDIRVTTELPENDPSSLGQTLRRSKENAYAELNYNYSTYPLGLAEEDGHAVFKSLKHLGPGISLWWANGWTPSELDEHNFELLVGRNYIYFAAIGMKPHFHAFDFDGGSNNVPTVEISSKIFTIDNEVSAASYGTLGIIVSLISVSTIMVLSRKRNH